MSDTVAMAEVKKRMWFRFSYQLILV